MTSQFLSPIWKIDWLADPLFSFKVSVQIESWRVTFNPSRDLGHKFEVLRRGCWGAAGKGPPLGAPSQANARPQGLDRTFWKVSEFFPFSSGSCQGLSLDPQCGCSHLLGDLGGPVPSHARAQVALLLSLPCASRTCPCSSGFCTDPQPVQVKECKSCPSNQLKKKKKKQHLSFFYLYYIF